MDKWVSVKDRTPKPLMSVLVFMPGQRPQPMVHEGFITDDGAWIATGRILEPGEVTHWMSMPLPPDEFLESYIKE